MTRRRTFPQRHPPSQGNFHSDAGFSIQPAWVAVRPHARESQVGPRYRRESLGYRGGLHTTSVHAFPGGHGGQYGSMTMLTFGVVMPKKPWPSRTMAHWKS